MQMAELSDKENVQAALLRRVRPKLLQLLRNPGVWLGWWLWAAGDSAVMQSYCSGGATADAQPRCVVQESGWDLSGVSMSPHPRMTMPDILTLMRSGLAPCGHA